ncbi:unnamed protein product [Linum trigynum]|uniref:Uncharacterized protein n=1 Tax=Linum trigynum TaxID=586398 RepID=A0AAV2FCC9_9ROSI
MGILVDALLYEVNSLAGWKNLDGVGKKKGLNDGFKSIDVELPHPIEILNRQRESRGGKIKTCEKVLQWDFGKEGGGRRSEAVEGEELCGPNMGPISRAPILEGDDGFGPVDMSRYLGGLMGSKWMKARSTLVRRAEEDPPIRVGRG